ncbi:YbaK/EbsC family protein (plasmid) [Deinococcus metallilatus]|uniref:Prolyl-tRNA editing enzyme YbaK/EbsC (Cys-tRNA(Pro) deacylase) n=1 Tax=Deinococcus metallilatus TaxID=1211322 RepID=A0AAJ5F4R1_9DEIO|nr:MULTISPECIES: YbaK/EbsC family protein [Deinococcus]MBB5293959.1 prolyl-tRNA editing enzyme YbaK/EbsC (Cys-tRNA(Pro) deacylase) [Deinococcus metallilatus]QBY07470.1 YbaK/EbsC family protein [Deinococcus metallilatus]RXJ14583.1 YbaK/EbsC family protein [Deinococcus metallilatus]TLK30703.1 YbaK/EbsC family protein [Deinococcus metallilatus]
MADLAPSARKVQDAWRALGVPAEVVELPGYTRTAAEAAATLGCDVEEIAKSLVFRMGGGEAVLVMLSGRDRVDETRLAECLGEAVGKADAAFVRECTGFAVGGVPPVGHVRSLVTLLDDALLELDAVWAAAGTPHAVARVLTRDLRRLPNARIATLRERREGTSVAA